jgi:hypothetical protein
MSNHETSVSPLGVREEGAAQTVAVIRLMAKIVKVCLLILLDRKYFGCISDGGWLEQRH